MNLRRVWVLAYKEWREVLRDRIFFILAFFLPVMLMLIFGYGLSQDVEKVPFALIDYDHTQASRNYSKKFTDSRYFDFRGYLQSIAQVDELLARGEIRAAVVISDKFQERLMQGRSANVQVLLDGTFTQSIRTVRSYVQAISAAAEVEFQAEYVARRMGITPERARTLLQPVRIEVRYMYNQELRSIWAIASGLIMFVLTITAPLLTALCIAREKETGAIYNIYTSTLTRGEFLIGKLLPFVCISFINGIILWLMATLYFGAPFRGSILFFAAAMLMYVVCTSSLGLVVSLLVRTQQAALVLAIIAGFVIAVQFSGIFTPIQSLPGPNYLAAHFLPAMYFNNVVECSFLKGVGVESLWRELLVFAVFTAVMLTIAYALFKKRVRA